jgi:histidine ammonia-lyase
MRSGRTEARRPWRRTCALVSGGEINASHQAGCDKVQDPYSLRRLPQLHGQVRGLLVRYERKVRNYLALLQLACALLRSRQFIQFSAGP